MTKIRATAKCPSCRWKLLEFFESDQEVLDLVHMANETVDQILIDHVKSHEAFSIFLKEASKESPIIKDSHNGFRGSFDLKYQEIA